MKSTRNDFSGKQGFKHCANQFSRPVPRSADVSGLNPPKKRGRPKSSKPKPVRREQENPRGRAPGLNYHWRAEELRSVRYVTKLICETKRGGSEIEEMFALFTTEPGWGDYVPTMAEAYASLIDTVNRHGGRDAVQTDLPLVEKQTPIGKIRVIVQRLNDATERWEIVT